jgi:hypothetical protein
MIIHVQLWFNQFNSFREKNILAILTNRNKNDHPIGMLQFFQVCFQMVWWFQRRG